MNREIYQKELEQLKENINKVEKHLEQLRLQETMSQLFMTLNESESKWTWIPGGEMKSVMSSSGGFFKLESDGTAELTVHREGDRHWVDSQNDWTLWFKDGELASLCEKCEWKDSTCTLTVEKWKVSPSWYFPGSEPSTEVTNPSVETTTEVTNQSAETSTEVTNETGNESVVSVSQIGTTSEVPVPGHS